MTSRSTAVAQGMFEFASLGYVVDRLKKTDGKFVCNEAVSAGDALLAVPLDACWTKKAMELECPQIARKLKANVDKHPKLLNADSTWIALQILHAVAKNPEQPRVKTLPSADSLRTMIAWSAEQLQSIEGSRWKSVAVRRQQQLDEDLAALQTVLGADLSMKLDEQKLKSQYVWVRTVVQQCAIEILGESGAQVTVLVPGLNLLPDEHLVPTDTCGIRLESAMLANQQILVVYAGQKFAASKEVTLQHAGLACSTGERLMTCGSPWQKFSDCESVELELSVPVDMMPLGKKSVASIIDGMTELSTVAASTKPTPGECVPLNFFKDDPVKLVDGGGRPMMSFLVRFSVVEGQATLPNVKGLTTLGAVLAYDSSTYPQLQIREAGSNNVFGPVECQRRALYYLQGEIRAARDRYPQQPPSGTPGLLMGAEAKILDSALQLVEKTLSSLQTALKMVASPAAESASIFDQLAATAGGPLLKQAQDSLEKCKATCASIASTFKAGPKKEQGKCLMWELDLLASSVARCPLGDPMSVHFLPVLSCASASQRSLSEAASVLVDAWIEAYKWEFKALSPQDEGPSLVKIAGLQMRKLDFTGALSSLQKSITKGNSGGVEALTMASDCLMALEAPSSKLLDLSWKEPEDDRRYAFRLIRTKLRDVGYTKAGAHWSYPSRLPAVMKFSRKSDMSDGPLADAFKLFMNHEVVPLGNMVELLGYKASRLLLKCGAVTCYNVASLERVKADDAPGLVNKKPGNILGVFSNIMLWPLQEDMLVALDFEQLTSDQKSFDPVPCLTQDARALMAGAPRSKAASVLDVDCGSGAQGLMALKYYAEKAVFMDENPRALRFAEFNVRLHGLEKRASFVKGSLVQSPPKELKGKLFDAVLMCPSCFATPSNALSSNGGSASTKGGGDGCKALDATIKSAVPLLSVGGRLVSTAMLPNPDSYAERLLGAIAKIGVRAIVLRGETITLGKYVDLVTAGSSLPAAAAFSTGLQEEKVDAMAHGMLMFWKPVDSSDKPSVDKRDARLDLWSDELFVADELQGVLNQMQIFQGPEENMYDMEWGGDDDEAAVADQALVLPKKSTADELESCWTSLSKTKEGKNGRLASLIQPTTMKDMAFPVADGASWSELAFTQVFGVSLPCFLDQLWRKVEIPLGAHYPPGANAPAGATRFPPSNPANMALVEFEGCGKTPQIARDAVQSLDCFDQLSYETDGESKILRKKHFGGWKKKIKEGETPPNMLERYDTFILSFSEDAGDETTTLPQMMREFLTYVGEFVDKHNVARRIVVVTSGANGHTFPDGPPKEMLHRAAPLRGLLRCARQELAEMPILAIDTDAMSASCGDAEELADQISRELEAYTPESGLENATPEEYSEAVYKTHREVVWRKGERFFPGLNPAARGPLGEHADLSSLRCPPEGVALISGGSGGLGVVTGQALAELGVPIIILASRSGRLASGQGLEERVEKMRATGAQVVLLGGFDTSDVASIRRMMPTIREYGELKYVFHAAGISAMNVLETFPPKVNGAWELHQQTLNDNLNAFVCYASMTECLGTAFMSGYAQANTYMEELCRARNAMGLPATAVQFPEVMGVGMAAGNRRDAASVDNEIVTQIIKHVAAGSAPIGPVLSVLTFGFMLPRPPISYLFHAPLLDRVNSGLWTRMNEMELKMGAKVTKRLRAAMADKMEMLSRPISAGAGEGIE